MAKIKNLQKSTRWTLGSPNNSKMIPRCFLDDPRSILATFKKSRFSTKIRQNWGWLLCQIEFRQQNEDTGGKINKIDITPIPYFCWIRAGTDARIRQRSKNRAPVIWVPESLWAPRIPEIPAGGEGFAPLSKISIFDENSPKFGLTSVSNRPQTTKGGHRRQDKQN